MTLLQGGLDIGLEEVTEIRKSYWRLFARVDKYSRELQRLWLEEGGWIPNALGRPLGIARDKVRDSMNRVVQSTGHDLLIQYIGVVSRELDRRGISWKPVVIDWHDSTCVEVPESQASLTAAVLEWGVEEMNRRFAGDTLVPLRGEAETGYNLAEVKKPEA